VPEDKSEAKVKPGINISFDAVLELIHKPGRIFWINFKTGFIRGFAGILGAGAAIILIGFLVAWLGGIPLIGDFLKQISEAIKSAN
jgi:hypothetical protein